MIRVVWPQTIIIQLTHFIEIFMARSKRGKSLVKTIFMYNM